MTNIRPKVTRADVQAIEARVKAAGPPAVTYTISCDPETLALVQAHQVGKSFPHRAHPHCHGGHEVILSQAQYDEVAKFLAEGDSMLVALRKFATGASP